ncbi:MAG: alpha/beta hydrolase [Anaerolineales bacterium]
MLLLFLIGLGLLIVGIAYNLSNRLLYPQVSSHLEKYRWEAEAGRFDPRIFETWEREEVRIPSPYGYRLFGLYFPIPDARKTVIIVHGITSNVFGSVKYMEPFRKRGFNVLLYDHRFHGQSGGPFSSYGFYEREDLRAWMDWVYERCGTECTVGTHGESLGGVTVLQHAAIDPRPDFVVADCAFSTLEQELRVRLWEDYHLPPFPILPVANLLIRLRAGFSLAEVSPLQAVAHLETPVLFIHGKEDAYVPTRMSIDLYNAKPGAKALYLVPGARHARAQATDPEAYDREIGAFLERAGVR